MWYFSKNIGISVRAPRKPPRKPTIRYSNGKHTKTQHEHGNTHGKLLWIAHWLFHFMVSVATKTDVSNTHLIQLRSWHDYNHPKQPNQPRQKRVGPVFCFENYYFSVRKKSTIQAFRRFRTFRVYIYTISLLNEK